MAEGARLDAKKCRVAVIVDVFWSPGLRQKVDLVDFAPLVTPQEAPRGGGRTEEEEEEQQEDAAVLVLLVCSPAAGKAAAVGCRPGAQGG